MHGGRHGVCNYNCGNRGNTIVLSVGGVDKLSNVSTLVYQHLECPESMSGPGCEQICDCTERETCHYIRGCHIGKLYFETVPDSKNCLNDLLFCILIITDLSNYLELATVTHFCSQIF